MEADHPAQGERWSPDGSDEDTSNLTPQADRTETQAKHAGSLQNGLLHLNSRSRETWIMIKTIHR
eukprot:5376796-Pyramimonas_sp.AAC.1